MGKRGSPKTKKPVNSIVQLATDEKFLERIAKIFCNIYKVDGYEAAVNYLQTRVHHSFWDSVEKPIYRELKRRGYRFEDDPEEGA